MKEFDLMGYWIYEAPLVLENPLVCDNVNVCLL